MNYQESKYDNVSDRPYTSRIVFSRFIRDGSFQTKCDQKFAWRYEDFSREVRTSIWGLQLPTETSATLR